MSSIIGKGGRCTSESFLRGFLVADEVAILESFEGVTSKARIAPEVDDDLVRIDWHIVYGARAKGYRKGM